MAKDNPMTKVHTPIVSPCIRRCCLDESDVCLGCFRNLVEITQWTQVDDSVRREILSNASLRQQAYQQQMPDFTSP